MFQLIFVLALLCMGVTSGAAPPTSFPSERFEKWKPEWGSRTIEASGLSVRVEPRMCGDRRAVSEGCSAGERYTVVSVAAPGMQPATIEGGAGLASYIGIGKLGATRPSVILITENGGSGGCVQIDVAVPAGQSYRVTRLSVTAADHGTICQVEPDKLAWPHDLTGKGRAEFLFADDSFHCAFTSCAGSWYPPRVVAFDGTRGIDASSDHALAPLFRADMQRARYACEHRTVEPQGACAGFAADAARLGRLKDAWPIIQAEVRRGCRVRSTGKCYPINRIPADFPSRLAAALRRLGYSQGS